MRKQTIQYTSSLDALIAVAKRLSVYENQHKMDSEDFYNEYNQGILSDDIIFIEWANDYRHYLALRQELEQRLNHAANLRIGLRFKHIHLLEINEAIVITDNYLEFLDYRYHFQDEKNNLVFRYDSTPHFPNISTFPHHKHLPNDVISCHKPEITQVLKEATELLR
jgi:hypothetical protein